MYKKGDKVVLVHHDIVWKMIPIGAVGVVIKEANREGWIQVSFDSPIKPGKTITQIVYPDRSLKPLQRQIRVGDKVQTNADTKPKQWAGIKGKIIKISEYPGQPTGYHIQWQKREKGRFGKSMNAEYAAHEITLIN